MATDRRVEANRRNALKSTGPRTVAGKARSRLNAVTHGLTAQTIILPDEDPRAYQGRLESWSASLQPCTAYEEGLVRHVVGLSWRLERADRVQVELIHQSIGEESDAEARQAREILDDATRRLVPDPATPRKGADATSPEPDDPDDPARLVPRLERTADGCRWLLDRWAELRAVVEAGTAWDADQMTRALRLLGKRPLDAADDGEVLAIVVACFALDRARPDPFAALWDGLSAREVERYRQRLIGRRLREAMPASPDEAREILLEVVDQATLRLEELERALRAREVRRAELRPARLLFDDTPEGRWIRARQREYDHAIARIVDRFTRARRKGEPMLADPPRRVRSRPEPAPPSPSPPAPSQRDVIAAARRQRGRKWRTYTIPPHRVPGGRQPSRKEYNPNRPRPKSRRRRQTPEQIRRTAQRFVQLFKWLGLALFIAALAVAANPAISTTSAERPVIARLVGRGSPDPAQARTEGLPALPSTGDLRSGSPAGSETRAEQRSAGPTPRNPQNEPKDVGLMRSLRAISPASARHGERSRGPPGAPDTTIPAARPPPGAWRSRPGSLVRIEPARSKRADDPSEAARVAATRTPLFGNSVV